MLQRSRNVWAKDAWWMLSRATNLLWRGALVV
jgi:hypothetical protein